MITSAEPPFQSPNGVQIALSREKFLKEKTVVSITKRCTDCFAKFGVIAVSLMSFNHQTVYRLLSLDRRGKR